MSSQAFMSSNGTADPEEAPAWTWWLLLLVAICTLAVGVLLLVAPHRTLSTLAVILGIYLLVVGAIWIGVGIGVKEVRGAGLWRGVIALIAGAIVIRHPSDSITVLALAFGICLMIAGVFELVAAIESPDRSRETRASGAGRIGDASEASVSPIGPRFGRRGWRIFEGLVDLAVGVLIVSWPQFGIYTFAIVLGISLIVRGAIEAWLALAGIMLARRERHGSSTLSPA
jgi:uncharacterized membrane protein HdeD (DUF308 family)